MNVNFDGSEEITDYASIPAGTYLCAVTEIRERLTSSKDPMWAIRLTVAEGEFTGRTAAWDNLVFSPKALNRVKTIFAAMGLPHDGRVEVEPDDLLERRMLVQIRPAEYLSSSGTMVRRNEVPYGGYRPLEEQDGNAAANGGGPDRSPAPSTTRKAGVASDQEGDDLGIPF